MEIDRRVTSAVLPRFVGPPTNAPVVKVRDVAICLTGQSDGDADEYRSHPPIASPILRRDSTEHDPGPFDLGRGLRIDRLDADESDLVMNACMARGHHFVPIRQYGQRYSFVREYGPDEHEERPYRWDPGGLITDASMLSRLVRDNAYSTEYAARIIDHEDGEQVVAYYPATESARVYRLRRDRDWLDHCEAGQLRRLLEAWWRAADSLPPRVRRASWRMEYASWLRWGDLVLPVLVGGLEALVKTDRHGATRQFTQRVPALAAAVGVEGVTPDLCAALYDTRSEWVHGAHVRLFATGAVAEREHLEGDVDEGPKTSEEHDRFADIRLIQDTLRAAVRRAVEDEDFRDAFATDQAVRDALA